MLAWSLYRIIAFECVLVLSLHVPSSFSVVTAGQPLIVDVFFKELIADQVTSESGLGLLRDEVYIEVFGSTPTGNISVRLPRSRDLDDYYSFFDNTKGTSRDVSVNGWKWWKTSDGALTGEPRIWSGALATGQSADLFVVIGEQDNRNLAGLSDALASGLDAAQAKSGDSPLVEGAVVAARNLVSQIPDSEDDVIGAFSVHLQNDGGQLRTTWLPLEEIPYRDTRGQTTLENTADHFASSLRQQGQEAISFRFDGVVGGKYRGVVAVDVRHDGGPDMAHRYLITEFDACDPDETLHIMTSHPQVPFLLIEQAQLRRGEASAFPIAPLFAPNWFWKCGDSLEITKGGEDDIRYVIAERNGASIHWYAYNDESW